MVNDGDKANRGINALWTKLEAQRQIMGRGFQQLRDSIATLRFNNKGVRNGGRNNRAEGFIQGRPYCRVLAYANDSNDEDGGYA